MLCSLFGEERGAISAIVAFALVVLLGFAALVVDAGVLLEERRQLQNAVDGAALAAAQQISNGTIHPGEAMEQAYVYAEKNGVTRSEVVQNGVFTIFNSHDAVKVGARRKVNLFFAPVLGTSFQYVEAKATAIVTQIQPYGIWPWGVTQESIGPGLKALKLGARNAMTGNFMALDLPHGQGADAYRDYIMYGFDGQVPSGVSETNTWLVTTETGNVAGPTMQGVNFLFGQQAVVPVTDLRNPRVGLVPVLKAWTWNEIQGKMTVEVVGFAVFYLEDIVQGPMGLVEIHGSFREYAYGVGRSANVGGPLEGLIGTRLWE